MDRRLGECWDGSNVRGITKTINMRLSGKREWAQSCNFLAALEAIDGCL
jgi:hypothetical protein